MNNFLQHIYNELAMEHNGFTERDFSIQYLGKCGSYFAYLKSTNKEPSADAILKFFRKLNTDKNLYEQILPTAKSSTQKQIIIDWIALYNRLQGEVFNEMVRMRH
ncbi:MAG: hypothetical protein HOF98_05155 [Gammaproteobacteria bacterium]|nr:hypothetical protein [Gammaproteobacteria bacterium]